MIEINSISNCSFILWINDDCINFSIGNVIIFDLEIKIRPISKTSQKNLFLKIILDQQNSIYTTVVFWIVCDLSIFTPNNFSAWCDQTQFTHVDFDNGSPCDNS